MADDFSAEIKWWKNRAAMYDQKRANLRPISFDYVSKAASDKGNYNAASTFNSARAKLYADDASMRSRMVYTPPVKAGAAKPWTPADSMLKPSDDVKKAADQNDRTAQKIKELGGNAFRGAVGGLVRVADLLSRTGYALRSSSMEYAKDNAAGGTSFIEHAENAMRPIFDVVTMTPRVAFGAATGTQDETYKAMWEGFSGRQKTSGHDLLKVAFPEFTSDHKKWTSVLSFGVDVLYDPLSWVTVGQGTVVSGVGKGIAAGGAAAVGKRATSRALLSNTVWTSTGRAGGKEAVREGLYLRAGKPYMKKAAKADKSFNKLEKQFDRAGRKSNVAKQTELAPRVAKAKQVRDTVNAESAAAMAAIRSESIEGMELAWKAIKRPLSSTQAFGKGVNTAGMSGRASKEFATAVAAGKTKMTERFISAEHPDSFAWRKSHQDIIDSGTKTITYGDGRTFDVPDDYDEFVAKFTDILFPEPRSLKSTTVTGKDRKALRSLGEADDTQGKQLFTAYAKHLDELEKGSSGKIISPFRPGAKTAAGAMNARGKAAIKKRDAAFAKVGAQVDVAPMPGETAGAARLRAYEEAYNATKTKADEAVVEAKRLAEENHANASAAKTAADDLVKQTNLLRTAAREARRGFEEEAMLLDARTGEWMTTNASALAGMDDISIEYLRSRPGGQDLLDQLNGHGPFATSVRDQISQGTQEIVDRAALELMQRLEPIVTANKGTLGAGEDAASGIAPAAREVMIPGMGNNLRGGSSVSQRDVNYQIAKAIQEVYELVNQQKIVDAMDNDYELAWDAIQNNTNYILNRLFADSHLQIFTHLNAEGFALLSDSPHLPTVIKTIFMGGDSSAVMTPMGDVLARSELPTDIRHPGKAPYTIRGQQMEELRKAVPASLQASHARAMEGFEGIDWPQLSRGFDVIVDASNPKKAIETLYDVVDANMISNGLGTEPTVRLINEENMISQQELFDRWLTYAKDLQIQNHGYVSEDLARYSLYDYWTFGTSAKETAEATSTGAGKVAVGRLGSTKTAQKIVKTLEEEGVINEALNTIPPMDEDFAELTSHMRGLVRRDDMEGLRQTVARILTPDLQKVTQDDSLMMIKPEELMGTLGSHVYLLSDTTEGIKTSAQIALASQVWDRATMVKNLNETVMLFNLHNTLVMAVGPAEAAKRIARVVEKHPRIAKLMGEANALSTTAGTTGLRTPNAGSVRVPTSLLDEGANLQVEKADIGGAVTAASQAESSARTLQADAVVNQSNAAKTMAQADTDLAKATKDAEAIEGMSANVTTTPPANAPGGHTVPDITPEDMKELDTIVEEFTSYVDINGINTAVENLSDSMAQGFAEYKSLVDEAAKGYNLETRYMLKFAGIPVMPLPTTKSPIAAYAGMAGMKESQGRVHNWLKISEGTSAFSQKLLRPTSRFDAGLEDMRRSLANNAQNWLKGAHQQIGKTYRAYPNKATLKADTKAFWDDSLPVPEGLSEAVDRFLRATDAVQARALKGARLGEKGLDPANWTPAEKALFDEKVIENNILMNANLPKPYRMPEDIIKGFDGAGHAPWSREWLIALSKHLDKNAPSHTLAARNLDSKYFNIGSFEYAVQNAVSRVKLHTSLHESMFAHFTFDFDPKQVEVMNATLPKSREYIPLNEVMDVSSVYGDMGSRFVARDMAREMSKMSEYLDQIASGRGSDLNFDKLGFMNNHWKAMVTTWGIPKYHIANMLSDGFLSLMDGVGPTAYKKASQVLVNNHGMRAKAMADPEKYNSMFRPDLTMVDINDERMIATAVADLSNPATSAHVSTIRVNGKTVRVSAEDYHKAYLDFGLATTQVNGNMLHSTDATGAYDRLMDGVLDVSNVREDWFRMAHFVHAVENEAKIPGRTQAEIFKAARDRVIKYHFDYGDVSELERVSLGRYIPFYKWTRNIVPLAVSQLFTNPKTYIINNAANQAMGDFMFPTQEDANGNEIPVSYITPDYIADANMVPVGAYTDPDGNEQARYAVLNLPLDQALNAWIMPFIDPHFDPTLSTADAINTGAKNVLSSGVASSHPLLKALSSAVFDESAASGGGEPFKTKPYDWLTGPAAMMVPFAPMIQNYFKDEAKGTTESGVWASDNLLGLTRETSMTSKAAVGAALNEKDRLQPQLVKQAAIWMKKNYPGVDPKSDEGKKILHDFYVQRGVVSK